MNLEFFRQFPNRIIERYSRRTFRQNISGGEGLSLLVAGSVLFAAIANQCSGDFQSTELGYSFSSKCDNDSEPPLFGGKRILYAVIKSKQPESFRDLDVNYWIGMEQQSKTSITINDGNAQFNVSGFSDEVRTHEGDLTSVTIDLINPRTGQIVGSGSFPYRCPDNIGPLG